MFIVGCVKVSFYVILYGLVWLYFVDGCDSILVIVGEVVFLLCDVLYGLLLSLVNLWVCVVVGGCLFE